MDRPFRGPKGEIQRLAKWKNIADADAKATEIVRIAQATLEKASADATATLAEAAQKAEAEIAIARRLPAPLRLKQRPKQRAKGMRPWRFSPLLRSMLQR